MNMEAIIVLVVATYLANSVSGIAIDIQKELDYTRCASNSHGVFIEGIKDIVSTSDPLSLDLIPGNLPDFKYTFRNAQLKGLKDCVVTKLSVTREKYAFKYNLECPHFDFSSKYTFTGQLANISAQEQGNMAVRTGLYIFKIHGFYEKIVGDDKKEHANIKYYHLDFENKEYLGFKFTNVQTGDEEKSNELHKFMNDNWRITDKALRAPVLNSFMDLFINHLNDFLKAVPIEEVFKTSCQLSEN